MFKRIFLIAVAIILIGVITIMVIPFTNPNWLTSSISLARPNAVIRRDLLKIIPIGTSMEDVRNTLENNGWWHFRSCRGNFMNGNRLINSDNSITDATVEIGTQSLPVALGQTLLIVRVHVGFAFDEDSKLIDIAIGRYLDII